MRATTSKMIASLTHKKLFFTRWVIAKYNYIVNGNYYTGLGVNYKL